MTRSTMHTLNLTALFLDGEDGQRLAEVNGLPRLGALLSSAQLRQLARQLQRDRKRRRPGRQR